MSCLGIVTEPTQWHGAAAWFGFGWDHRVDAALLKIAVNFPIGISGIGRHGRWRAPSRRRGGIDALDNDLSFVHLTGRHLNVDNDAADIVDDSMLLI
jgi:hypothetical protein